METETKDSWPAIVAAYEWFIGRQKSGEPGASATGDKSTHCEFKLDGFKLGRGCAAGAGGTGDGGNRGFEWGGDRGGRDTGAIGECRQAVE
jgi:hypothetical protein